MVETELTATRKDRQRQALFEVAEETIALHGLAGLKARDLAREIGVALGAIYNLVGDLDEIILRVASRTLARLDAALAAADPLDAAPEARLAAVGVAYRRFASDNLHLWRALFEHRMAPDKPLPPWAKVDQTSLFRHILDPLCALAPAMEEEARLRLAKTMFGAVHGVVWLGLEEKFVGVRQDLLDAQIEIFVRTFCAGLTVATR
jgi:AcrR family transcriptional regulator